MMRVLVNDHSGHAFPIHLSKQLARKGFEVVHTYSANFQSPKGNFEIEMDSNSTLAVTPIYYEKEFHKYSIINRRKQELEFAAKLINEIKNFKPKLVINCNTPLFAQQKIQKYCIANKIKFIFWCQDIYSIAITNILKSKLGFIGTIAGAYFKKLEKAQLRKSDHIVTITSDFSQLFSRWNINETKITVIPNWAPIDEIPIIPKSNSWSMAQRLEKSFCFIYSGTLGLKHNPSLLLELAIRFQNVERVKVIVISEGIGADFLKNKIKEKNLKNLLLLPFQPFRDIPKILGCADVLVAVLEPDAGIYSVPSKILAYLCAAKPVLLSVPLNNLSSRIVTNSNAGLCADPREMEDFIKAADRLYIDSTLRSGQGRNARIYAEQHFNIENITNNFIIIIRKLIPEKLF